MVKYYTFPSMSSSQGEGQVDFTGNLRQSDYFSTFKVHIGKTVGDHIFTNSSLYCHVTSYEITLLRL